MLELLHLRTYLVIRFVLLSVYHIAHFMTDQQRLLCALLQVQPPASVRCKLSAWCPITVELRTKLGKLL